MEPQGLIQLYTETFGAAPGKVEKLPASGSNRQYYHMDNSIGCVGTSSEENAAFYHLAQHFAADVLRASFAIADNADVRAENADSQTVEDRT